MGIKKFSEEIAREAKEEVNIIPLMSLLVMLIPFLLITTVFVETAVFELHLPEVRKKGVADELNRHTEKNKKDVIIISLAEQGIRVGINRRMSGYIPIDKLKENLKKVKKSYQDRQDVIIASEPKIKYQKLIDVMDVVTAAGFSEISISGK